MIASYRAGAAVLRSDSASTLAIVKELVSKEATARRLNITDSFKVKNVEPPYHSGRLCQGENIPADVSYISFSSRGGDRVQGWRR